MSYRRDNRSVEQFANDIKKSAVIERDIVHRYAKYLKEKHGIDAAIENNGCDNSGALLNDMQVNTNADFIVNGVPLEVKFNNENLKIFRLKSNQLRSYIKQGAAILWVNGYKTDNPMFTLMKLTDLDRVQKECTEEKFFPWGGKLCFELIAEDFLWLKLPINDKGVGK